jgi:probable HAF family extracellular repeat protein
VNAINNAGQFAGFLYTPDPLNSYQAYVTGPSGTNLLPLTNPLNCEQGIASAINDAGYAVGTCYDYSEGKLVPFLATPGSSDTRRLFPSSGTWPSADVTGINDAGRVIGVLQEDGGPGFITGPYGAGGPSLLEMPSGCMYNRPTAINASAVVTGYARCGGSVEAFVTDPGGITGLTFLGSLPGTFDPTPVAINDAGQIVGSTRTTAGNGAGFITAPGTMGGLMSLGVMAGGTYSVPTSINASGYVVGIADPAPGEARAFVRTPDGAGGLRNLDDYVDGGWEIWNAFRITDAGVIYAQGILPNGQGGYLELTPTSAITPAPEPATLVLVGSGALALGALARKRRR